MVTESSRMLVNFGKHEGKTVEMLVLKEPDYVKWVLYQPSPSGELERIRSETLRLIAIFDHKPILGSCTGRECVNSPVRFSAYAGSSETLYTWCGSCDPYEAGANSGRLTDIYTHPDALAHVDRTERGVRSGYRAIVKAMAVAKGLPNRSGEAQVRAFFDF
jgi:hypothetical protein